MSRERPPATFEFQADYIDYLIGRCVIGGKLSPETWMVIKAEDIEELQHISQRLRRMTRHEDKIKRIVMGK